MTAGVVCEYNPFHKGHEKQFRQIREALGQDAGIVCLMSGSFVQRGEPAIFDKQIRAAAAADGGANLVLELPVTVSLRSAEGFASGAAEIFAKLGCADTLAFGCECGSGDEIQRAARTLETEEYRALLKSSLSEGLSYPAAREKALLELTGDGNVLRNPNDILAVEYCRALLKTEIKPLALLREGEHGSLTPDPENPSAAAVRALLPDGAWEDLVPKAAAERYRGAKRHRLSFGERAVLARLRGLREEEWERAAHGSEGLWSKAMKAAFAENSVEGILTAVKSKRYPRTRLQRLLLCAYLGLDAETLAAPPPYVRALAFDETGREILKQAREKGTIPVINAGQTPPDADYSARERRCEALYALFAEGEPDAAEKSRVYLKTL
jgi:predicted nucleotidyltransferase